MKVVGIILGARVRWVGDAITYARRGGAEIPAHGSDRDVMRACGIDAGGVDGDVMRQGRARGRRA